MANLSLYHLFLVVLSFHFMSYNTANSTLVTTSSYNGATNFIRISCRATLYPVLCYQSLSVYASKIQQNERQLAKAALSVSLAKARFTTMFVSKLTKVSGIKTRELRAVQDCMDNMGDTVDQLSRSLEELSHMNRIHGGQDFMWHMSNVQTWVSAALTNENTCSDGFAGNFMEGNVKAVVNRRIVTVAQVTSNALALVNRFAERHQAAAVTNLP
ncbi:PMEI domain-containing protein [Heracleum sosnowskyi]|uniref:PMEI domain-containing protein n=1 Tax=Heracleum sosnowskyi TaxID=360622 RepID=A0AAD8IC84_9APIA|nr:PMEI domain-containing protein [Heracleum sosnowskyi]